jgi:hypothetical protein
VHDHKGPSHLKQQQKTMVTNQFHSIYSHLGDGELLTMDSFMPILLSSSSSRRSEMWLPIPILLFICASACCLGQNRRETQERQKFEWARFYFGRRC